MVEEAAARRRPSSSRLREAARKLQALAAAAYACASFSRTKPLVDPSSSISNSSSASPSTSLTSSGEVIEETDCSFAIKNNDNENSTKNMCAICLDPLSYNSKGSSNPGQAIFTAQCSHAFHFACISSNVRHGSVTCPICRAHWTQLPRNLNKSFCNSSTPPCTQTDPILQILDDSIATFRVHRRSLLHTLRYDNDDPIEPDNTPDSPKLCFSLVPLPPNALSSNYSPCRPSSSSSLLSHSPYSITSPSSKKAYISVKQSRGRATDFVLVVSTNGPHLRLLKQAMALVVFSLRNIDRLAIVTYTLPASSSSPRVFPLRRMTSYGKRTALQLIDRINYMRQADPIEGLKKGIKILEDRMHRNPESRILHLSDNPTIIPYHTFTLEEDFPPTPIHQFHVGFGASNGFIIHEFEEFLGKMLMGGNVGEIQLRIRTDQEDGVGRMIWIGELRGEERIVLEVGDCKHVHVEFSYVDECVIRSGEIVLGVGDHRDIREEAHVERRSSIMNSGGGIGGGRPNCVGSWDFHDPYMARRWAKYLHGYRL